MCCVLLAVLACYLPVLGAPFIWDDQHLIEQSPLVRELRPLPSYFQQGFWQADELQPGRIYYRPLTILSFAIDYRLYGSSPGGFHLTNLLLHLASTAVLYRLLRVRGTSGYAAVFGAAFWALYPRSSEAVAWVSGRTDLLATWFVLCALLARMRGDRAGRALSASCLLLGLFCKEVALAGVLAVLVCELAVTSPWPERLKRAAWPMFAVLVYALLRFRAAGIATQTAPGSGQLRVALAALGRYVTMLATPWVPNLQIGRPDRPSAFDLGLGCAVLVVLGVWLLSRTRRGLRLEPEQLLAFTLTASGLLLVLHLVPLSLSVLAADRFLYLPLVGLVLGLTPVLAALRPRKWRVGAGAALLASFAFASHASASTWADEVERWTTTYRQNPDNPSLACVELGRLYARAGLVSEAYALDRQCAERAEGQLVHLTLVNNGASVLARGGHYAAAIRQLARLEAAGENAPIVSLNLALFLSYAGDFQAARQAIGRALAKDPDHAAARSFAAELPRWEALRAHVDALPGTTPAAERARLLAKLGLTTRALLAWQAALSLPSAPRGEFEQALWYALAEGDADSVAQLERAYRARFSPEPRLSVAYEAHRDLAQALRRAWPALGVERVPVPSAPSVDSAP